MDVFKIDRRILFDEVYLIVTPTSSEFKNEVEKILLDKVEAELKSIGGQMYDDLREAISVQAKAFKDKIKSLWCKTSVRYTYWKAVKHISGDVTFQIDREKAKPPKPPRRITSRAKRKPNVVAVKGRPSLPHSRRSGRAQRKAAAKIRRASGGDADLLLHATNQVVDKDMSYLLRKIRKDPSLAKRLKKIVKNKKGTVTQT